MTEKECVPAEKDECDLPKNDWTIEYAQLSEDFRKMTDLGWQATVAVLVGDALIVSAAHSLGGAGLAGLVLWVGGAISVLMAWTSAKWTARGRKKVERLRKYDKAKSFNRFAEKEPGWMSFPTGWLLAGLILLVGAALLAVGFLLIIGVAVPSF